MSEKKKYNLFVRVRRFLFSNVVVNVMRFYYNQIWGTHIGKGCRISRTAKIDKTYPEGVVIGEYTAIAFHAAVLTHDFVNGTHKPVRIGKNCFIGAKAVVMPGVTIGDNCIVATGTIVMRDVPPNCVVMGNPGRVMERDIQTGRWGQRIRNAGGVAPADPVAEASATAD